MLPQHFGLPSENQSAARWTVRASRLRMNFTKRARIDRGLAVVKQQQQPTCSIIYREACGLTLVHISANSVSPELRRTLQNQLHRWARNNKSCQSPQCSRWGTPSTRYTRTPCARAECRSCWSCCLGGVRAAKTSSTPSTNPTASRSRRCATSSPGDGAPWRPTASGWGYPKTRTPATARPATMPWDAAKSWFKGRPHSSPSVSGEISGHNRLRSQCLQVQCPVPSWTSSISLGKLGGIFYKFL